MIPVVVVLVLLIPILAIVLDSDVGRAIARRLERGSRKTDRAGDDERMRYVESEVERLSRELARLGEESQFLHKLLSEGVAAPSADDQAEERAGRDMAQETGGGTAGR